MRPWRWAANELLRAGPYGNAIAVGASEAARILIQWHNTRAGGITAAVASGALILLALALLALLYTAALSIGGLPGLALASIAAIGASTGVRHRVWRIPLALALVRYGIVRP
jgi:hypothetical protein